MTKRIKMLLVYRDVKIKELAQKLKTTPSNITNKFKRDNFSEKELIEIFDALDCDIQINIIDRETNRVLPI